MDIISITTNKKNSLSHLFPRYRSQILNLENYNSSDLKLSLKKYLNDTYLKVFDQHITKSEFKT